ncbi:MAG: MFS transporter [Lachnospiraceae bacterium]|nr:MFS transporter [Lachnospiraceae bacterium]
MEKKYNYTIYACFVGYIVQAIVNNFVPLLFLTFHGTYGIPMTQITLLITFNFGLQLLIDLLSVTFVDKIGYRASMVIAHICAAVGFVLLTILPDLCGNAFVGLLAAVTVYAVGGGLLEVLVSPVMEACPTDNKEKAMSLLHSFYCWGHVAVVIISTLFFRLFGIDHWKVMACIWAVVPFANMLLFMKVPIASLIEDGEQGMKIGELFKQRIFWVLMLMMVCAGASEQAVSQWASTFAELGLGVSKTVGDLAGPMLFAVLMGSARAFYGKYGDKIELNQFMAGSSILCIMSYLCISLVPNPVIGFVGCALCGLSVGIMWPGTFSKATASIARGGTAMFALLALAGDVGCSGGPTVVGMVSGALGDDLKKGILAGVAFPILLLVGIFLCKMPMKKRTDPRV